MLRILVIILLLINGAGALYGGWSLMHDPSGEHLHMPLSYLQHTPFYTYFYPGIILFVMIGVLSLTAAGLVILQKKKYPVFVFLEGGLLFGWILVQTILLHTFHYLHAIYGSIGLILLFSGVFLHAQLHPFTRERV